MCHFCKMWVDERVEFKTGPSTDLFCSLPVEKAFRYRLRVTTSDCRKGFHNGRKKNHLQEEYWGSTANTGFSKWGIHYIHIGCSPLPRKHWNHPNLRCVICQNSGFVMTHVSCPTICVSYATSKRLSTFVDPVPGLESRVGIYCIPYVSGSSIFKE